MKKLFFLIFILFLFLFPISQSVRAQTVTPPPKVVTPESTNVVIKQDQSWIMSLLQGVFSLKPANNQYFTTDFSTLGQQLQKSGKEDLMPKELQAIVTPDLQPKTQTMTSVFCVRDPKTGKFVKQFNGADRIQTQEVPGLKEVESGAQFIAQYTTHYVQKTQDYTKENVVAGTGVCDDITPTGEAITSTTLDSQNQTSYTGSIFDSIKKFFLQFLNNQQTKIQTEFQGKEVTPWIHVANCLLGGCTKADVASVTYDPNIDQVVQSGGAVAAMYKPADVNINQEPDAENSTQQWDIAGTTTPAPAYNFGQAAVVDAGTYMNCTLMPADYQNTAVPDGACDTNWTKQTALPPSDPNGHAALTHPISANFQPVTGSSIQQAIIAATAGKIPQCVLEGVGQIEGAYNKTYLVKKDGTGQYDPNGVCGPNECSAIGPFQITTGKGPASDPYCKTCGAGHCPNSLPSGINPCDTDSAARGAVILLMAKTAYFGTPLSTAAPSSQMLAIRNAGDSYYGSTAPLSMLGGLSYGEFLYAHCINAAVTHSPHSFPPKGQ